MDAPVYLFPDGYDPKNFKVGDIVKRIIKFASGESFEQTLEVLEANEDYYKYHPISIRKVG